jgi:uncharacterized protein
MKYIPAVILFFFMLFFYTKLVGPIPFSVNSVSTTKSDSFVVTGEGKSTAKPDIAYISAGVTTSGSSVKLVQNDLNSKINAVSDAVKKVGVDPKDIKTTNYSIHPRYDYHNNAQRIIGYDANTNFSIKIRNLDSTNAVIDAATAAGANQVGGITFDVDDKTKAQDEARQLAVKEAKDKAIRAASIAGFSLGKIINYDESFGSAPRPIMFAKADALAVSEAGTGTNVEPGSNEISVSVTLTYQLN